MFPERNCKARQARRRRGQLQDSAGYVVQQLERRTLLSVAFALGGTQALNFSTPVAMARPDPAAGAYVEQGEVMTAVDP